MNYPPDQKIKEIMPYSTDVPDHNSIVGRCKCDGVFEPDVDSCYRCEDESLPAPDDPFYTFDSIVLTALDELDRAEYPESFSCPVCGSTNDFPGACCRECYVAWNSVDDEPLNYYSRI